MRPVLTRDGARRRRGAAMLAAAAMLCVAAAPPRRVAGILMPTVKVLSVYDKTVVDEKLNIPPVTAGLGPVSSLPDADPLRPQIDVAGYRVSLDQLQGYVNALAANGPRHDIVPRVELIQSERVSFETPNNAKIRITTAALDTLAEGNISEEAFLERLFFLLGHEYAHVLYDHPRRYAEKTKSPQLAEIFSTGLGIFATVNQLAGGQSGGQPISPDVIGAMQGAIALSPLIELELYRVGFAPYRKEQESLADFASADLLATMGAGNAGEASRFLERYQKYDNSLIAQLKKGLDTVEKQVAANMTAFGNAAPTLLMNQGLDATLKAAQDSLIKAALEAASTWLANRFDKEKIHLYYSAEKRVEAIGEYVKRFHGDAGIRATDADRAALGADAPLPKETVEQIAKRLNVATPKQFLAGYARERGPDLAAQKAYHLLMENHPAEARAALDAARKAFEAANVRAPESAGPKPAKASAKGKGKGKVSSGKAGSKPATTTVPTIVSTYFHIIDGMTYVTEGRLAEGEAAYLRAVALPGAPALAYIDLATLQSSMRNVTAASATLDRGAGKLGERYFVVEKIRHHGGLGDTAKVATLVAACGAYADLVKDCAAAVPKPAETDEAAPAKA